MLSVSVPMSGVCGRAEQQRLAEPRHRGHGAGPDGDPGHVEQGQLPQAAGGRGQEQAAEHVGYTDGGCGKILQQYRQVVISYD